ncbi:MAG: hypothetical protein AAGN35_11295, partial [Bacteroidota bacterium]
MTKIRQFQRITRKKKPQVDHMEEVSPAQTLAPPVLNFQQAPDSLAGFVESEPENADGNFAGPIAPPEPSRAREEDAESEKLDLQQLSFEGDAEELHQMDEEDPERELQAEAASEEEAEQEPEALPEAEQESPEADEKEEEEAEQEEEKEEEQEDKEEEATPAPEAVAEDQANDAEAGGSDGADGGEVGGNGAAGSAGADENSAGEANGSPMANGGGATNMGSGSGGGGESISGGETPDPAQLAASLSLKVVTAAEASGLSPESIVHDYGNGTFLASVPGGGDTASPVAGSGGPIQMKPDPQQQGFIIPPTMIEAILAQQMLTMKGDIDDFERDGKAEVKKIDDFKEGIPDTVDTYITGAKALIEQHRSTEEGKIKEKFSAAMRTAKKQYETSLGAINGEYDTAVSNISGAANKQRKAVEAAFNKTDPAFDTLITDKKAEAATALEDHKTALRGKAKTWGDKAIAIGDQKAAEYEKMPVPEMNRVRKFLNGDDFEQKRHAARVEAARATAKEYKKKFDDEVKADIEALDQAGTPDTDKYITDEAGFGKEGIATRKKKAIEFIDKQEKDALAAVLATKNREVGLLETEWGKTEKALIKGEKDQLKDLKDAADAEGEAIDETAKKLKGSLVEEAGKASKEMSGKVEAGVKWARENGLAEGKELKAKLNQKLEGIRTQVKNVLGELNTGLANIKTELTKQANKAPTHFQPITTAAGEQAKQLSDDFVTQAKGIEDRGVKEIKETDANTVKAINEEGTGAVGDIEKALTDKTTLIDAKIQALKDKLGKDAEAKGNNFKATVGELPADIKDKAQKAHDAVKGRFGIDLAWWLGTLIKVVVAIVVTTIVVAAFLSGGFLVALAVGAAVGALGGMLTYLLCDVGLDGKEFSGWGLTKAGIAGAVSGMITALGAGAGSALTGALSKNIGGVFTVKLITDGIEVVAGTFIDCIGSGINAVIQSGNVGDFKNGFSWDNVGINFAGNLFGAILGAKLKDVPAFNNLLKRLFPKLMKESAETVTKEATQEIGEATIKKGTSEGSEAVVKEGLEETTEALTKEASEEITEESTKEIVEEGTKDVVEEGTKDVVEEGTKDVVEEGTKDVVEEGTKDVVEEGTKDVVEEGTKDVVEEGTKDVVEEGTKDVVEEGTKDVVEEGTKDVVEEGTKDVVEEGTKDVVEEGT